MAHLLHLWTTKTAAPQPPPSPAATASQPALPTHRILQLLDQQELALLSSMLQYDDPTRHLAIQEHEKLVCARKEALGARAEKMRVKQKGGAVAGCEESGQEFEEQEMFFEMHDGAMVGLDSKFRKEKYEEKLRDLEIEVANLTRRHEEDLDTIIRLQAQLEQYEKLKAELRAEKEKNRFLEEQIGDKDEEIEWLEKQRLRSLSSVKRDFVERGSVERGDSGIFDV